MPPRRKRSKPGLSRMDAALENMRPLGFADGDVRQAVKDLLKVYGEDGWFFIEEFSYKVLLDKLLETLEPCNEEQATCNDGNAEFVPEPCFNGLIEEHTCSLEVDGPGASYQKTPEETGEREDQNFDFDDELTLRSCSLKEYFAQPPNEASVEFSSASSPMPMPCEPRIRRRKPCYGWISDDEDDKSGTDDC